MNTENKRYKVYISETPIFGTLNSIDKPSLVLGNSKYANSFIEIPAKINWVNVFTINGVFDKTTYTMLKLEDTVTNEVLYFLNNQCLRKLSQGFEMEYRLDIFLSFGYSFLDTLTKNKLMINIRRFLNNDLLREWFVNQKYTQLDPLLEISKGNILMRNNAKVPVFKIDQYEYLDFANGNVSISKTFYFNNNPDGAKPFLNINNPDLNFKSVIFHVYENTDGNYYCFAQAGLSSTTITLNPTAYTTGLTASTYTATYGGIKNAVERNDSIVNGYGINKKVGLFVVPPGKNIFEWFVVKDPNNNSAYNLFGFRIGREGYKNFIGIECQEFLNTLKNDGYNWGGMPSVLSFENNMFGDVGPAANPGHFSQVLHYNNANPMTIHPYFISQLRAPNSTVGMCPVLGYDDIYQNGFLEFDGNNFNAVNQYGATSQMIDTFYGTMNTNIDSYKAYVAQTKPMFNTSLEVAKSNLELTRKKAITNGTLGSVGNVLSGIANIFTFQGGKAATNFAGAANNIANSVFTVEQAELDYANQQKQQDAQLASTRLSSTANNICASGTNDDSIQKLLVKSYFEIDKTSSLPTTDISNMRIYNFVNSVNDYIFMENLIYKNGIIGDMFVSAEKAFTDSNKYIQNPFCYIDFEFPIEYIRMGNKTLPVEYVRAIFTVLSENSIRLGNSEFFISAMPDYYVAFQEVAYDLINGVN